MTQLCPTCDALVEATLELTRVEGLLTSDKSTCTQCGRILWTWVWEKDGGRVADQHVHRAPSQLGLFQ